LIPASRASLIAKRAAIVVILLFAVVYTGDYLLVRWKMAHPKTGEPFGTVRMERLYAIPQKNGKIDYEFDALQPEVTTPCVHSIFPHMGDAPCWYLLRNSQKPIPM
jgi:hypothetical protein